MARAQYTIADTEREVSAVEDFPKAVEVSKQAQMLTIEEIEDVRWLMMTDLRREDHRRANAMCDAALRTIAAEARLKEFERSGNLECSLHGGRNSIYFLPQKSAEFNLSAIHSMYWAYED